MAARSFRKLRLPRFSLRLLLVSIAMLCAWLAWERSVVLERQAFRKAHAGGFEFVFSTETTWRNTTPGGPWPPMKRVSWIRGLLGDEAVQTLLIDQAVYEVRAERSTRLFPEAESQRTRVWIPAPPQIDAPVRMDTSLS